MKHLILIAFMVLLATSLHAKDKMSAADITKKAHLAAYYQGNDGSAQLLMRVYAKDSDDPIKKLFYMLRRDLEEGGKQRFFTYFVAPVDIKGTTFLVHKYINQDDYRRLYIPASDKIIPIAGSRKQDPFMGSDFTYEDVSGRHYTKDNHKLLREDTLDGKKVYVTESIPKIKEEKIAKMIGYIDQKSFIPLKVEFYNHDGKKYRTYQSLDIKDIGGFPTITKRVMTSHLKGTKTEMLVNPSKVKYNVGLDKDLFTERALKNPPVQYFK